VGDAAIGIASVSRACGCADAFMTTNVVDTGASVGITFKTYPDKLPGAFTKTFYVITDSDDNRTKLVQLVVTGTGIVKAGSTNSLNNFSHETHPPSRIRLPPSLSYGVTRRWAGENHENDQFLNPGQSRNP
jgi:hypothetical protein